MTEPARTFQHYEVLRRGDGTPWELGRGAMGVTYKAFDVNLCCEVALKVVSSALVEHPEARERFVREARAAAALRHRNVASVYHLGNDGGHFFYAMEFINGETLDALVRRGGPLSVENTLRVVLQVARALAAAERQHLVHRDLKPTNLMVTHEDADEETVVKVIDFGLARTAATDPHAAPLTLGGFVGTPQYASPEQLEERPLDARSDFYSLGVTAWFLLTGRTPFTGSLATICQQQLTQPPPWEQLSPDVPAGVRALLGHLLAKDAARRPQNAAELRAAIEACLAKVQGAERRRDLHLATLPAGASAVRGSPGKTTGRVPQAGTVLNTRYRLLREIGGRDGSRVYQARDESDGEKLVVVKLLPETLTATAAERTRLAEEVRLVQAAAHPRLVQIRALERSASPSATFLVEEWLAGFTLRDLLAGRGGALPVVEALRLLGQAAEAADHAARCRLDDLDLALPALHLSFPGLATAADDGSPARALLSKSVAEWPDWTLKIHAFRPDHDPLALDTWAGGVTLVPAACRGGEKRGQAGAAAGVRDVPALAKLVYEMLGGTPTVHQARADAPPARYVSLAVLNEEANRLLRQTLAGGSSFENGWQFHEALAHAVGGEPARGAARSPVAGPEIVPVPATVRAMITRPASSGEHETRPGAAPTSYAFTTRPGPGTAPASDESVAPFFQDRRGSAGDPPEEAGSGSAWDRLSLVNAERAHPGRWLAGIVGLAAVFGLVFVGVLAWLLGQTPVRSAVTPPAKSRRPTVAGTPDHAAPRQATVSPSAAHPAASTPPDPAPVRRENFLTTTTLAAAPVAATPAPSPPVAAAGVDAPPPSTGTPPMAEAASTKERLATVRVDSVPQGALIRLGNEVLGITPCRVRLTAGEHLLVARYQNGPEVLQTIRVNGTETHAAVEILLMPPELVPSAGFQPPGYPDARLRRIFAPSAHRGIFSAGPAFRPPPAPPSPNQSEPETRPSQPPLTPFRMDDQAAPAPARPSAGTLQPFSANDGGRD